MSSYPRQEGIPEAEQLNDHRIQMLNQPNEGEDQMSEHRRQRFHRRMALIIFVGIKYNSNCPYRQNYYCLFDLY